MVVIPAFGRFLLFYGAVFAAFGVAAPFLPGLLRENGLSSDGLGVALAAGTAIRLVTGPLGGRWADRADRAGVGRAGVGRAAWVLGGFTAAAAGIGLLYGPARGLLAVVGVSLLHAAVLAPIVPIADALATGRDTGRREEGGFRYGWVRGAGSAAFVGATLVSGWAVGRYGLSSIVALNAGLLAVAAGAALLLPRGVARAAGKEGGQEGGSVGALLRERPFLLLMVVAGLIGGSHAMHDGFEVIRWREAGMSAGRASVLWSLSVGAEVVVFTVIGPAVLERLGVARCLLLAAGAGVVRWAAAAVTASFAVMATVEPLHGVTFALMHLACVQAIARTVPAGLAATAQAFYGTVALGVTGAAVSLASGPLYGRLGADAFWGAAGMCLVAAPLTFALRLSGTSAPSRPPGGPRPGRGSS